jgi:hypothetical protein
MKIEKEIENVCNLCRFKFSAKLLIDCRIGSFTLLCNECQRLFPVSLMNNDELRHSSAKLLKEYCKSFGLKLPSGIIEKDDLIKLILEKRLSDDNFVVHRMNRSASLATIRNVPTPSPTSSSSRPDRPTLASVENNPNPFEFLSTAMKDLGKGLQDVGGTVKDALKEMGDNIATVMKNPGASSNAATSSPGASSNAATSSPGPSHTATTSPNSYNHTYPENRSMPVLKKYDSDPPTITTLATTDFDLSTLTTKALKRILLRERVSTTDINDREELIRRVGVLVGNVGKELNTSKEEDLCKVCFERNVNCVFLDCGHLACCIYCAEILQRTTHECPLCRSRIIKIVHVFK